MVGMDNNKHKLVVIVGSVRDGRFGPVVASWVAEQAGVHGGFDVDVIDLAEIDIPLSLPAASPKFAGADYPRPDGIAALTSALEGADAFSVVTPEYNHSYPASLKAALKASKEPKAASIALANSPVGLPPALGPMICQNMEWFE